MNRYVWILRSSSDGHCIQGACQPYNPTLDDIRVVCRLLQTFVPFELADIILREAEYYSNALDELTVPVSISQREVRCAAVGPFTQEEVDSIARVEAVVTGHDQGWSSYPEDKGTTRNSWTWYSLRSEENGTVSDLVDHAATNLHAVSDAQTHVMEWVRGDDIVKQIRAGQTISIWAHARYASVAVPAVSLFHHCILRFPGWTNHIQYARLRVALYPQF